MLPKKLPTTLPLRSDRTLLRPATLLPTRRAASDRRGREVPVEVPGLDATLADYIAEAVEADAAEGAELLESMLLCFFFLTLS